MSPRARQLLWAMMALGLAGRVVLAFKSRGVPYDTDSLQAVRYALSSDPLHVYSIVNGHPNNRWPYPPAFFPWIAAAGGLSSLTALTLHGWALLPQIAADAASAWFVQDFLGGRGAGERLRLGAAALVLLGPAFWIVSGYHGHIDSLAMLPAVIAVWLWDRWPAGTRRAAACGLLIGLGTALKVVPILMLLVLLPWVSSRRDAAALVAPAIAVPLLAFAPFLAVDWHGTVYTFKEHRALPGFGGTSLFLQPRLAGYYLHHDRVTLSGASRFVFDNEGPIVAILMAPFAALSLRRRLEPALAAALLYGALLVVNPAFEFQYAMWALPFALMAGFVWQVATLEALLFVPAALLYWHPFGLAPTGVYLATMMLAWVVAATLVVKLAIRLRATYSPTASSAPRSR